MNTARLEKLYETLCYVLIIMAGISTSMFFIALFLTDTLGLSPLWALYVVEVLAPTMMTILAVVIYLFFKLLKRLN